MFKMTAARYAALKTAVLTFVAMFASSLLGFVNDVAAWAGTEGEEFPSVNPLGKAAVAAFCAALVGLLNLAVNFGQSRGVVPGRAPKYDGLDK